MIIRRQAALHRVTCAIALQVKIFVATTWHWQQKKKKNQHNRRETTFYSSHKKVAYFYSVLTETQVKAFLLQEYRKRHGNRIIIIICLIKATALYAGFYNSVIVAGDDLQGCKGGPARLLYNLAPSSSSGTVQCFCVFIPFCCFFLQHTDNLQSLETNRA